MQLGRLKLTPAEWQRRITQWLCIYCGQPGHVLSRCPALLKDSNFRAGAEEPYICEVFLVQPYNHKRYCDQR